MKTDTKKIGTKTATAALQQINAEIEALHQKRIGLAEPLLVKGFDFSVDLSEGGGCGLGSNFLRVSFHSRVFVCCADSFGN